MIENYTEQGGHFKVGISSDNKYILLQVQNKYGEQAREALTSAEAKRVALLLLNYIEKIK